MYDLLVRGGRVIDGTGGPWFRADVAVVGDRIVAMGHLEGREAARVARWEACCMRRVTVGVWRVEYGAWSVEGEVWRVRSGGRVRVWRMR